MANTRDGLPGGAFRVLQDRWPGLPWASATEARGAFHGVIVLAPDVVIRVRSDDDHADRTAHERRVAHVVGDLGLDVPRPVSETVSAPAWSAIAWQFRPGAPLRPGTWRDDRRIILPILDSWRLGAHRRNALVHLLPAARSWCGGPRWPEIVERLTHHDRRLHDAARRAVRDALAADEDAEPTLVHGDFGPHNILVADGRPPALIDIDNAAWADPALDVAPLLAHYDHDALARDITTETLRRATVHRASLPLQVAAAASLGGDTSLRDHALTTFARRALSSP